MGKGNIDDANVEAEKTSIYAVNKMNFMKLQTALAKNDEPSWQAAIDSSGYKKWSKEYNNLARVIHRENAEWRKILTNIVSHVSNNEFIKALQPENRTGLSLAQAMEYIVKKENEKQEEVTNGTFDVEKPQWAAAIPAWHPTLKEIFEKNEQYGNLIVLTRMVEYWYLPKINYTFGEVVWSSNMFKKVLKWAVWVWLAGPVTSNVTWSNWFSGKYRVHEENFYNSIKNLVKEEKAALQKVAPTLPDEAIFTSLKDEVKSWNTALTELEEAVSGKDTAKIKSALSKYREVAKTPFHKWRINTEKFTELERKSITAIEEVNTRIEEEFKKWKEAQVIADSPNATPEQKKTAIEASTKYNQSVMELEAHGIKNLQQLSPEAREIVMKENPWAAKVATANGGIAKLNGILGKVGSHWAWKTVLGVGVIWLLWDSKWGITDLWNKWDYVTLSKMGWDVVAGAVPIVSSLHETAMLSNALWYRDVILGKGYEMSNLEKGFRVAWAIPLGAGLAVAGGKLAVKAWVRWAWHAIVWVSEIIGNSVKTIWTVGTYWYLWYQATQVAYNVPMHLFDKK